MSQSTKAAGDAPETEKAFHGMVNTIIDFIIKEYF